MLFFSYGGGFPFSMPFSSMMQYDLFSCSFLYPSVQLMIFLYFLQLSVQFKIILGCILLHVELSEKIALFLLKEAHAVLQSLLDRMKGNN